MRDLMPSVSDSHWLKAWLLAKWSAWRHEEMASRSSNRCRYSAALIFIPKRSQRAAVAYRLGSETMPCDVYNDENNGIMRLIKMKLNGLNIASSGISRELIVMVHCVYSFKRSGMMIISSGVRGSSKANAIMYLFTGTYVFHAHLRKYNVTKWLLSSRASKPRHRRLCN